MPINKTIHSVADLLIVVACCIATSATAGAANPVINTCLVSLIDDVEVSAQEQGIVVNIPIREGDQVELGTLLLQLDETDSQLALLSASEELRAALARSEDDIEVRYAEAAYAVAHAELEQAIHLNQRLANTVPFSEVRRLELTAQRASLEIDRRKLEQRISGMGVQVRQIEVDRAQANLDRRHIDSPIVGQVLAVYPHVGETVQPGEPVARIARIDRLRVEGLVDGSQFDPAVVASRPVTIEVELAGGIKKTLEGTIVFVSPLVQAGNRYRVRAEIMNYQENGHWVLRPGMSATMTIQLR